MWLESHVDDRGSNYSRKKQAKLRHLLMDGCFLLPPHLLLLLLSRHLCRQKAECLQARKAECHQNSHLLSRFQPMR